MPEPTDNANTSQPPPTDPTLVASLVDAIKAQGETIVKAVTVARTPPAPDPDAEAERVLADGKKRAEALLADGKTIDGLDAYAAALTESAKLRQRAPDPAELERAPEVAALKSYTLDKVRSEERDLFDAYGTEIDAEIAALPVRSKVNLDVLREVAGRVRARHARELEDKRVNARIAEERAKFNQPPPADAPSPDLGEDSTTALHGLNVEERETALHFMGEHYEKPADAYRAYARIKEAEARYERHGRRQERALEQDGVSILPPITGPRGARIKPGRF